MSFLDDLPPDQKELIISLPYRVGVWISHSDDIGGAAADDEEIKALANIIDGFTRDVFGSEAVQHIMMGTVSRKDMWPEWAANVGNVNQDCQQAIDILNECVDEKEVNAFRQRLLEIAETVALAFREYDRLDFMTKLRVYVLYYTERYKAARKSRSFKSMDQFLNISLQERKALSSLAQVLGLQYS